MILAGKITEITGAKLLSFHSDIPVQHLLLDSRKIISPANSIFFAIKGIRHDGHQYMPVLYKAGVRCFIVEENTFIDPDRFPGSTIWQVKNSIHALQKIVAYHRKQFHIPVIGITGSNGKTIIKEWLSQLLNKNFSIVKNPKSYNSQTGVPLSVWEMNGHHTLGIFEAGISLPGEMEKLENIIQPSIGIFSNLGPAHDEGFKNREEKILEKLKLFTHCDLIFYRKDHTDIDQALVKTGYKTFCWSTNQEADVQFLDVKKAEQPHKSGWCIGQTPIT